MSYSIEMWCFVIFLALMCFTSWDSFKLFSGNTKHSSTFSRSELKEESVLEVVFNGIQFLTELLFSKA